MHTLSINMIVPSSMFKRINSVFGTPSTSSPFISWAGGDGDGGGGGPKRKLVGDTFNLSNTMSYARYAELSSVDNESDDEQYDWGFEGVTGFEDVNPLSIHAPSSKKLCGSVNKDNDKTSDIDETSIMHRFINAKNCCGGKCSSSYGTSPWTAHYDQETSTPLLAMLNDSDKNEHINNKCKRLLSVFKQFDDGDFRTPEKDSAMSSAMFAATSTSATTKKKQKKKSIDQNAIPEHVLFVKRGRNRFYQNKDADDAMFWKCIHYLPEFGSERCLGKYREGNSSNYDPDNTLIYEDEDEDDGKLYLGGVKYNGEYVGGSKQNVVLMVRAHQYHTFLVFMLRQTVANTNVLLISKKICTEFEDDGFEACVDVDGELVKLNLMEDSSVPPDKDLAKSGVCNVALRKVVYDKMDRMMRDGAKTKILVSKAEQSHENKLQQNIKRLEGLEPLGTMDIEYTPFYQLPKEERDRQDKNVTKEEIRRFEAQFELLKKSQEDSKVEGTKPRAVSYDAKLCSYMLGFE